MRLAHRKTGLSPPVKYYTDFQGGTSFVDILCVFFCFAFAMPLCVSIYLLGKDWPLGSRLWFLNVSLSLSPLVSWVSCGT